MEAEQIIAMRMANHGLTCPMPGRKVVRNLCGIQSQFAGQARHALMIRASDGLDALDDCVRTWTMRGTMHMILKEDVPLYLYTGRKRMLRPCDTMEGDETMSAARKEELAEIIADAVRKGEGERENLRMLCREKGMTAEEENDAFDGWGGLLRAMAEAGRIAYTVETGKRFTALPEQEAMDGERAKEEILRRYFGGYNPATVRDAAYFTGWGMREVRAVMDRLELKSVKCGNETYYATEIADAADIPACVFLAGFDPMMLGYEKKTSLHLPEEYLRGIFGKAGIVAPAVLLNGRVAGKWRRVGKKIEAVPFRAWTKEEQEAAERVGATVGALIQTPPKT